LSDQEFFPADRLGEDGIDGPALELLVKKARAEEHGEEGRQECGPRQPEVDHDLATFAQSERGERLGADHERQAEEGQDEDDPLAHDLPERVARDGNDAAHRRPGPFVPGPLPAPSASSARTKYSSRLCRRGSTARTTTRSSVRARRISCKAPESWTRTIQQEPTESTRCPAARRSEPLSSGRASTVISHSRTSDSRIPLTDPISRTRPCWRIAMRSQSVSVSASTCEDMRIVA